jgi:hypothetical protein
VQAGEWFTYKQPVSANNTHRLFYQLFGPRLRDIFRVCATSSASARHLPRLRDIFRVTRP